MTDTKPVEPGKKRKGRQGPFRFNRNYGDEIVDCNGAVVHLKTVCAMLNAKQADNSQGVGWQDSVCVDSLEELGPKLLKSLKNNDPRRRFDIQDEILVLNWLMQLLRCLNQDGLIYQSPPPTDNAKPAPASLPVEGLQELKVLFNSWRSIELEWADNKLAVLEIVRQGRDYRKTLTELGVKID